MEGLLITVCMVSYNSSQFIKQAIEAVLQQTYQNFELIICDDNSKDDTWRIIETFRDHRVIKIRNAENLGEYSNRNKIIGLASGQYLIFIDADDIIYSHGLEFMMQFARQFPQSAMIISRPWDERIIYPCKLSPQQLFCFEYLDNGAIGINFTKILFRADILRSSRLFPEKVKFGDMYIQYEVGKKYPSLLVPDASTWWRRSRGQASENLLSNYSVYLRHDLWIKLSMLADPDCPLDEVQKHKAWRNIYGNYLRHLLKQILRFNFYNVYSLYRLYPVPIKYFFSVLQRQQRNFFSGFNGDNPLQSL